MGGAAQRIAGIFQTLGSLLPRGGPRPRAGQRVMRPWREDSLRMYPTVGITPARALAFLQAADGGSPALQFELYDEMLHKWPRLAAVEATRRLALTGLEWELVPAGAGPQASQAAEFCRRTFETLHGLREALAHMARAIGHGIAVAELVWEAGRLVALVPVPHARLITDPNEPWRLRIRTEEEPARGIAIDEQPHKWLVHRPHESAGGLFGGGLLRASLLPYLAQNLSFKDWLIYSQIAGMPMRVAQFEPGTPEDDKRALLTMLDNLGTEAAAIFSKTVDVKLLEAGRAGDKPYQPLQDYCNTEITILWLGQHLTTDIRNSGSRAAAEIHDRVREDLLVDDIKDEGQTLRRDVLTPLTAGRFGPDVPVPIFRRSLAESVDTKVLAETLALAVRELGLRVPQRWAHRALGIPEPRASEPVLDLEGRP